MWFATNSPRLSGSSAAPGAAISRRLWVEPAGVGTAAAPMPRTRSHALLAVTTAR
jgi:hypothetical protein